MLLDMEVNKKNDIDIDINMEIQFDGHGGQLIGPKLVRPKLTRLACLLSFASLFDPKFARLKHLF